MYYPTELLSKRRKGRLAHCWYAATTSEKLFKKVFKSAVIISVDVSIACEEIVKAFVVQGTKKIYTRFSLYLSSQLMFGVTRILSYQTNLFQNHLFDVNRDLEAYVEERGFAFDERMWNRDVPSIDQLPGNDKFLTDLHVMRDEPVASAFQYAIQDAECLNFGMLTNEEMDFFFQPGSALQLGEMQRIRLHDTGKTFEESTTVPLADIESYEANLEEEKDIHPDSSRRKEDDTANIEERAPIDNKIPRTPRKRSSLIKVDTPTKRSRLGMECSPLPEAQPGFQAEIQAQVPLELEPLIEAELSLIGREEQGEFVIRRRKRKTYDRAIQLSGRMIQNWMQDVTIHTREPSMVNLNFKSARKLLTVPSTTFKGSVEVTWSSKLMERFISRLAGPFVERTYFTEVGEVEDEEVPSAEAVRLETLNRTVLAELSSQIANLEQSEQHSKMTEKTLAEEFVNLPSRIDETKELQESGIAVQLPEITGIDHEISDAIMKSPQARAASQDSFLFTVRKNLTKNIRLETKLKTPSTSSASSFNVAFPKVEALAILDVHFDNRGWAQFDELVPPESYNAADAACCFLDLLGCHTKKTLVLKQAVPFDTIFIHKYPTDDSESSTI